MKNESVHLIAVEYFSKQTLALFLELVYSVHLWSYRGERPLSNESHTANATLPKVNDSTANSVQSFLSLQRTARALFRYHR